MKKEQRLVSVIWLDGRWPSVVSETVYICEDCGWDYRTEQSSCWRCEKVSMDEKHEAKIEQEKKNEIEKLRIARLVCGTSVCKNCKTEKPLSDFIGSRMQETKWCFSCLEKQRAKGRLHYSRHSGDILAKHRKDIDRKREYKRKSEKRVRARKKAIIESMDKTETRAEAKKIADSFNDMCTLFPDVFSEMVISTKGKTK